jgi:hypothetical protein
MPIGRPSPRRWPLTGAELGRQFGLSPRWGRDRVAEVHAEAIATGNGSRPTEHHARETPGLDHRRASLTLRPEGRPTDDADSGADSALGESNGSAPPSARRAASVPPSIDGASSAVTLRGRLSSTLINEFEELSLTPSVQPVQTILAGPVEGSGGAARAGPAYRGLGARTGRAAPAAPLRRGRSGHRLSPSEAGTRHAHSLMPSHQLRAPVLAPPRPPAIGGFSPPRRSARSSPPDVTPPG